MVTRAQVLLVVGTALILVSVIGLSWGRLATWWREYSLPTYPGVQDDDAATVGSLAKMREYRVPPPELRPVLRGAAEVNAVHLLLSPIDEALAVFRAAFDTAYQPFIAPLDGQTLSRLAVASESTSELDMREFRKMLMAEALLTA